jgi:hypothetical protein
VERPQEDDERRHPRRGPSGTQPWTRRVRSVRASPHLVVTTIDPAGRPCTVTGSPSDTESSAADGAPVSDAGGESSAAGARRGST